MVSQSLTLGNYRDVRVIHRVANRLFLLTGTLGTIIMLVSAFFYPDYIKIPNARLAMIIMAPSIMFCCMVSSYRGVTRVQENMIPTAVSQIVEVVGKLLFGLALAAGALNLGLWQYNNGHAVYGRIAESADKARVQPAVCRGRRHAWCYNRFVFSFAYLYLRYRRYGNGITKEELSSSPKPQNPKTIFRALLRFAVPVAFGTLATQLSNLIDSVSFQKCLAVVVENSGDIIRDIYSHAFSVKRLRISMPFDGQS